MNKNNKEYVTFLENKILEYDRLVSSKDKVNYNDDLKNIKYANMDEVFKNDELLKENKRLWDENSRLLQTVIANQSYIDYLNNSFWWKLSFPFRWIWRFLKNIRRSNVMYLNNYKSGTDIKEKISVVILSYNNEGITKCQINNILNQKYVNNIEIIVVESGVKKKKVSEEKNIKYINLGNSILTSDKAYIKILPYISGDYVVMIDQNKIVESNDWMYKALTPIVKNQALATFFFDDNLKFIKKSYVYPDLKQRICKIDEYNVLFLPVNREIVEYISPEILGKTKIVVKKRISNYYLI